MRYPFSTEQIPSQEIQEGAVDLRGTSLNRTVPFLGTLD